MLSLLIHGKRALRDMLLTRTWFLVTVLRYRIPTKEVNFWPNKRHDIIAPATGTPKREASSHLAGTVVNNGRPTSHTVLTVRLDDSGDWGPISEKHRYMAA